MRIAEQGQECVTVESRQRSKGSEPYGCPLATLQNELNINTPSPTTFQEAKAENPNLQPPFERPRVEIA